MLSFTDIWGLLCWLWIFPWIEFSWHSCSIWEKPGWFWQFHCEQLFSFNLKGFYYSYVVWSPRFLEERTSFCTGLISRKLCGFLLMFWAGFTLLSLLLFFLYWLPSSFLCTAFDSIFFYQNDIYKFTNYINDIKTIKIKET